MISAKNKSQTDKTWGGVLITSGSTYVIQNQSESNKFLNDDNFITSLTTGDASVINDAGEIATVALSLSALTGTVLDSSGVPIVTNNAFSSSGGFRFRGASVTGSIPANTTVNIDYQITQERYINGGLIIVDNIGPNDKLSAQVVDVNNVIGYGPGVVLDEFIKDFFIPHKTELNISLAYPAKIPAGLFLRLKYTSTHADGANLKCNLYLHWKPV